MSISCAFQIDSGPTGAFDAATVCGKRGTRSPLKNRVARANDPLSGLEYFHDDRFAERRLVEVLGKLRQSGYALLQAANPKLLVTDKGAADPNVITATLLCRSLTHLKAVQMLLREGLIVEARTIVRNCLENAFWLAAIVAPAERDEALRRIGDAELFTRQQIGQFAMRLRGDHGAEENEALREAMRKFKGLKGSSGPTPKELAKLGQFSSTTYSMPNTREMRILRFTRWRAICRG